MNKIISNDEMWKKQVAQDNIEKYTYAIKLMEKHTELERLKYKYETLKSSNKMLADDLKEVDLVIDKLKRHQWSFDNDPQSSLKNVIMDIIKDF
jgi:ppGpp synthetase/RelA/SpoT-type nucleotidyltranferase